MAVLVSISALFMFVGGAGATSVTVAAGATASHADNLIW